MNIKIMIIIGLVIILSLLCYLRYLKKKNKLNSLDIYVIFSISCLILYTLFNQYICIHYSSEYMMMSMDTLTTCFFGVFGGEILTCALIKIFKLKERKNEFEGGNIE